MTFLISISKSHMLITGEININNIQINEKKNLEHLKNKIYIYILGKLNNQHRNIEKEE